MSSSSPPGSAAAGVDAPKKKIGFVRNVMKNKHNFIQFFAMTGILLLSIRSLGQKYRIHDLLEDTAVLKDEEKSLSDRMNHIKSNLFHEASLDSTGNFASRLRALFGDDQFHIFPEDAEITYNGAFRFFQSRRRINHRFRTLK